jgi:hypothetical protein
VKGAIGLADFLAALRDELHIAAENATTDWLKLGVEELTLTVDMAYEQARSRGVSAKATAKFWVFLSAEAAVEATASGKTTRTHTLTLRLKPRIDVWDDTGQTRSYQLDVGHEQDPPSLPHRASQYDRGQA